ncbi:MAG TPA: aminotransferase class V-fold PLP-dependent enzyme [Saprospiraceae bacterium]|nr:aminotransferase class V-fold PLP-dependent enzyme [Saprospiraceae bacterium]
MPTNSRRTFIKKASALAGLGSIPTFFTTAQGKSLLEKLEVIQQIPLEESIRDETFWYQIKQAYTVSPNIINLNNGGVCPAPKVVQDAVDRYNKLTNEAPSYYMWRILDQGREPVRRKLAELAGCSPEEVAINRNSSEALETVIFGLPLEAGDEVVLTKQDYPNMINAWKQREKRDGIVLKWISFDFPMEDEAAIVQGFTDAFTEKTKIVHVTHLINWIGQILPARAIADAAHARGIEVVLDAAHSFAHIPYTIPELDCDYFGTSLHKWLCAPIGSGMLYVKKDKIKKIYPLLAAPEPDSDNIRKFEHLGTRAFPIEQAIGQAVEFHHMIGSERKARRLHYLKNYWAEQVMGIEGIHFHTSLHPDFGGAIGLVSVKGKKPGEVSSLLFRNYKIHTTSIVWENISGVRITPNVYTTTRDLDVLVKALKEIARG